MTRVIIVVGIRLYREGLARLLGTQDGLTVVGMEGHGHAAVTRLDELEPDVALVDVGLPDLHEVVQSLSRRTRRIPLVAIGIADSDEEVLAWAERGFSAYVTREDSIEALAATIRGAANGEVICSPRRAGLLMRHLASLAGRLPQPTAVARLTRREREVAALMREDLSNKEIATRLRIELATVKNHVHNVLGKLDVHRRADAVRLLAK
jgi:two-component system, NarL family, nitrate/nitrite response regulator NarL